jgi:hypothetical protein
MNPLPRLAARKLCASFETFRESIGVPDADLTLIDLALDSVRNRFALSDAPEVGDIVDGCARTLFLLAYADGIERRELIGSGASGGQDWDDTAPRDTDPAAGKVALDIVARFEDSSGHGIDEACIEWMQRSGEDAARFGHCLAMVATGQGVGFNDDIPSGDKLPEWIQKGVPDVEFHCWDFETIPSGPVWEWDGESLSRTFEGESDANQWMEDNATGNTFCGDMVFRDSGELRTYPTNPLAMFLAFHNKGCQIAELGGEDFAEWPLPEGWKVIRGEGGRWFAYEPDGTVRPGWFRTELEGNVHVATLTVPAPLGIGGGAQG